MKNLNCVVDSADVLVRAQAFVDALDQMMVKHWEVKGFTFSAPPRHKATVGGRWIKIMRHDVKADGTLAGGSAYAFVALEDFSTKQLGTVCRGDIHKPASYAQPAKHARGNVFHDDFGNGHGPYSMSYLNR